MKRLTIIFVFLTLVQGVKTQTYADSLDAYAREVLMPAEKYKWDWGQATMLNAMVHLYHAKPDSLKPVYLKYITTAMDLTYNVANGLHPNAIASGHGMAFLARVTKEERYREKAGLIYADYLIIPRTRQGGVSHRTETIELWDDTIYMLSMFMLEMYRLTGDEKYIKELYTQLMIHKEKLADPKWGLWVHGYDDDSIDYKDRCCQFGWANLSPQRKSVECWGRGNGWVVMAIADALNTVPKKSVYYKAFAKELKIITQYLPQLQDKHTGLWYQLPVYPDSASNFLESSCTAMFAYGMSIGVRHKVLNRKVFMPVITKAYNGLQAHATKREEQYAIPAKVCEGTCIGNRDYYFNRKTLDGANYAIGSYIMFDLAYSKLKR